MSTLRRSLFFVAALLLLAIGATLTDAQGTFLRATRLILDDGASPSVGRCEISSGSGSPEGSVTGDVCDVYLRTDGTTGAVLYVKATGSGSTGWETAGAGGGGASPSGGGGTATVIRKEADESVTSSTTLQDDNELTFSIAANAVYVVDVVLVTTGGGGNWQGSLRAPTGATGYFAGLRPDVGTAAQPTAIRTSVLTDVGPTATGIGIGTIGSNTISLLRGYVVNGSTAGTVTLAWGQGTSNATATTVKAGSYLIATRVDAPAPDTMFVATTGSDTTGDGSSGAPFATVGHALSLLPDVADQSYTINVADGTYAEDLTIPAVLAAGARSISIVGNTTTPANVIFTGTESHNDAGNTISAVGWVDGPVRLTLSGVKVNATADRGIYAGHGAQLVLDRSIVTGTLSVGVQVDWHSFLEVKGDVTVSGWADRGIQIIEGSHGTSASAGTLTITGPGSAGYGMQIVGQSSYHVLNRVGVGSTNITITGVQIGFQLGFNSSFSHQLATSTITVDNVTTPGSSIGVQCTDHSNWSTTQPVVLDHLSIGWDANSISYVEAVGTRTLTSVTTTSDVTQNSVVFLP